MPCSVLPNITIFYNQPSWGLNVAVLYNRIGKRIIGVGRTVGTSGEQTTKIPNSYEMPRDAIDLSLSKKFGSLEIKASVRDLLAQRVNYKQFGSVINKLSMKKLILSFVKLHLLDHSVLINNK